MSKPNDQKFSFFENVINLARNDQEKKLENIHDIEEMYQEFLGNYKKYQNS